MCSVQGVQFPQYLIAVALVEILAAMCTSENSFSGLEG